MRFIRYLIDQFRHSLLFRIRLLTNALVLITITLMTLLTQRSMSHHMLDFYKDTGIEAIETTIAQVLSQFPHDFSDTSPQSLAQKIGSDEFKNEILTQFNKVSLIQDIITMALYNTGYKEEMVNGEILPTEFLYYIQSHPRITGQQLKLADRDVLLFASPIEISPQVRNEEDMLLADDITNVGSARITAGYLVLVISLERFNQQLFQIFLIVASIGFFLLVLTIIAQNLIFRVLMRQLGNVIHATTHIARGNYDHRLNCSRNDELGQLAKSFDAMAAELENKISTLADKNHQLEKAYRQLDESKELIIKQEKLASLGTMVAGIAHEINNPTQAIKFSMESLKLNIQDLQELMDQLLPLFESSPEEYTIRIDQLKSKIERMDLDLIFDEIHEIAQENDESLIRIENIVKSTKRMAYADLNLTTCNVNEILEDAITLAYNQIKYDLTIAPQLSENLPVVQGSPQELGQVFINLIINARDAIKEKGLSINQSELRISTTYFEEQSLIEIRFKDNGTGIKKEIKHRIFDPFFTTKIIGQGTGLGLNICHQIIESHHGQISVESEEGQGTEFIIQLPVMITS